MNTIKDIAKKTGFHISTVSRALRGVGYVKKETADIIKKTADDLSYIADSSAQQLRNKVSRSVGIIISDIGNPFYNLIISLIEQTLKKKGLSIFISYSFENAEEEIKCFYSLMSAKVSTIIFTPVADTNREIVDRATKTGINVIQLYRKVYDNLNTIIFDDEYGCYLITKHLAQCNCKRILLIDVFYDAINNLAEPSRAKGYHKALKEFNHNYSLIFSHRLLDKDCSKLTKFIMENKPDGIIAGTNNFAMETLNILKTLPNEIHSIKFATFDDLEWVSFLDITAIHQPIENIAQCITKAILNPTAPITTERIKPCLITRKSTDGKINFNFNRF